MWLTLTFHFQFCFSWTSIQFVWIRGSVTLITCNNNKCTRFFFLLDAVTTHWQRTNFRRTCWHSRDKRAVDIIFSDLCRIFNFLCVGIRPPFFFFLQLCWVSRTSYNANCTGRDFTSGVSHADWSYGGAFNLRCIYWMGQNFFVVCTVTLVYWKCSI